MAEKIRLWLKESGMIVGPLYGSGYCSQSLHVRLHGNLNDLHIVEIFETREFVSVSVYNTIGTTVWEK